MMVLLFYFLIAVVTAVTASALIGLLLTDLIIGHFKHFDRVTRWISSVDSGTKKERHTIIAVGALSTFLVAKLKLA